MVAMRLASTASRVNRSRRAAVAVDRSSPGGLLVTDKRRRLVHTVAMQCIPLPHNALLSGVALALFSLSLLALPAGVSAQSAAIRPEPTARPEPVDASAMEACQRAAKQSLTTRGVPPLEVTLNTPTLQAGPGDSQMLRGAGRWKSAAGVRNFNYSCNVDKSSPEALAMVMQDVTPAAAVQPPPARPPAEPNLSELSPAACESSAVAVLQQRWPRATEISFDSATRTFKQESATMAELHGSIRARPQPNAAPALFGFDCELDPRNGRVLRVNVSG